MWSLELARKTDANEPLADRQINTLWHYRDRLLNASMSFMFWKRVLLWGPNSVSACFIISHSFQKWGVHTHTSSPKLRTSYPRVSQFWYNLVPSMWDDFTDCLIVSGTILKTLVHVSQSYARYIFFVTISFACFCFTVLFCCKTLSGTTGTGS